MKGTALITALMVMGVLTAISLAVSALIIRELGVTRLAVDYGKAYYAAESGVELALLEMKDSLAGKDVLGKDFGLAEGGDGNFSISSTSQTYPYFDETYKSEDPAAYYLPLDVGQSVTIPLFTESDKTGVKEFVVQYYANFNLGDFKVVPNGANLNGWDVLRWKVYGIKNVEGTNDQVTESINDFTGVSTVFDSGGNNKLTGANTPSWFGSVQCDPNFDFLGITCVPYDNSSVEIKKVKQITSDGKEVEQDVFEGSCLQTEAREHYVYTYDDGQGSSDVWKCYSIKQFLDDHTYNYLTLTNMMNPAVLSDPSRDKRFLKSRLYFRVVVYDKDEKLPREYAEIASTGKSGDSRVKLDVLKKKDSYLPVFNFVLYHTADEPE